MQSRLQGTRGELRFLQSQLSTIRAALHLSRTPERVPTWGDPAVRISPSPDISEDAEVTSRLIGWLFEKAFPLDVYDGLCFHVATADPFAKSPTGFDDSSTYVDVRQEPRGTYVFPLLASTVGEEEAIRLLQAAPHEVRQWFGDTTERDLRLMSGHIGSGKTTFVKHEVLKCINGDHDTDKSTLFFLFDCNPFLGPEVARELDLGHARPAKWWEAWFAEKLMSKAIIDFVSGTEGDTSKLVQYLYSRFSVQPPPKQGLLSALIHQLARNDPGALVVAGIEYVRRRHSNAGVPLIVIDNSDQGSTPCQLGALYLLEEVSRTAHIKALLPVRDRSWLALKHRRLPFYDGIVKRTFFLPPPKLDVIFKNRLSKLSNTPSAFGNSRKEIVRALEAMGNVSIHSNRSIVSVRGDLRDLLVAAVESLLSKDVTDFLYNYSNGNVRRALILLANFFQWGGLAEEDIIIHFLSRSRAREYGPGRVRRIPVDRVIRRLLMEGMNAKGQLQPGGPVNIFEDHHHSGYHRFFVRWHILDAARRAMPEGLSDRDMTGLARLCAIEGENSAAKQDDRTAIYQSIDFLLSTYLLESTGGLPQAAPTLKDGHRIVISLLGAYYLDHLSRNLSYLSSIRYATPILQPWSNAWEDPVRHNPEIWQRSSNIEFVVNLANLEIRLFNFLRGKGVDMPILTAGLAQSVYDDSRNAEFMRRANNMYGSVAEGVLSDYDEICESLLQKTGEIVSLRSARGGQSGLQ